MLVTFHSDAYENITYFGGVAERLLALMGHSGAIPGAIKSQDLPQALSQLQQGLAQSKTSAAEPEDDDEEVEIDLGKRALPLLNMLQASIKNDCDVLWDA